MTTPRAVIVMGVSGSGKTTLGQALAAALGWPFIEGDKLHPQANIDKMYGGTPLDDRDRIPWFDQVARTLEENRATGVLLSCSALKRKHRDFLRDRAADLTFVLPVLDRERLVPRVRDRAGHFMPLSLLESQLEDFEFPDPDEDPVLVAGELPVHFQVALVLRALEERTA
jgi:gluconokinase